MAPNGIDSCPTARANRVSFGASTEDNGRDEEVAWIPAEGMRQL